MGRPHFFQKPGSPLKHSLASRTSRLPKTPFILNKLKKNPYHIERHTLRLLTTLGDMIRGMKKASRSLNIPLYVLYGGKDVFSDPKDVKIFLENLPETTKSEADLLP